MADIYQKIPLSKIEENEWNPNKVEDVNFNKLMEDISKSGGNQDQPILLRPKGDKYEVVDGAHRFRALKELGIKDAIAIVKELEDKDAKLKTISMNKFRGDFDSVLLAELIVDLKNNHGVTDEEIEKTLGYSGDQIKGFESLIEFDFDKPEDPEVPEIDDNPSIVRQFILDVTEEQEMAINEAIDSVKGDDARGEKLTLICKDFLTRNDA